MAGRSSKASSRAGLGLVERRPSCRTTSVARKETEGRELTGPRPDLRRAVPSPAGVCDLDTMGDADVSRAASRSQVSSSPSDDPFESDSQIPFTPFMSLTLASLPTLPLIHSSSSSLSPNASTPSSASPSTPSSPIPGVPPFCRPPWALTAATYMERVGREGSVINSRSWLDFWRRISAERRRGWLCEGARYEWGCWRPGGAGTDGVAVVEKAVGPD